MKKELGKVQKNDVTLTEYSADDGTIAGNHFIKCGVVGFYASERELKDLFDVLNYYLHIEEFAKCKVFIEGEHVSIS